MLWRIVAPHFVAGLIVENGRVREAAPILGWTQNRSWGAIKRQMRAKGWHVEPLS
jgi:uncharacterized protein involved in copper resistance